MHKSDCATNNEPAYPAGPCTCGLAPTTCMGGHITTDYTRRIKCDEEGDWVIIAPDGTTYVSCDSHIADLAYGDGRNVLFAMPTFTSQDG